MKTLGPYFTVDQLLPRTMMACLQLDELHKISREEYQKFGPVVCLANMYFFLVQRYVSEADYSVCI